MLVKHQLESYSFLYLEQSNDVPDIEKTMIIWKITQTQTIFKTLIKSFKTTFKTLSIKFAQH